MTTYAVQPTNVERAFGEDEIIVSTTDPSGRITSANDVFLRVGSYSESEVLGQPHSIVRHPDMPRCVFKLLWDTIQAKQEIFAWVKNMAKNGDHYWVFAHVTPSFDKDNNVVGSHFNRRAPRPEDIATIEPLYQTLLEEENRHEDRKKGMAAGYDMPMGVLQERAWATTNSCFPCERRYPASSHWRRRISRHRSKLSPSSDSGGDPLLSAERQTEESTWLANATDRGRGER